MTEQASVVAIRGAIMAPAPKRATWWWFRHLVWLGDECMASGVYLLAADWYVRACEWVPELPPSRQSIFEAFLSRAKQECLDSGTQARRYRAACAIACAAINDEL